MVTENGDRPVAVFVVLHFSLHCILVSVNATLSKLILKRERSIIGTENFRRQVIHALLEEVVEPRCIHSLEDVVRWLLHVGEALE